MDCNELIFKIKTLCDRFAMPCPGDPTNEDIFKIVNSLFELRQMRNTKNTLQMMLATQMYSQLRKTTINKSVLRMFDKKIDFLARGGFEVNYIGYLQGQGREIIYQLGKVDEIEVINMYEGEPDSPELLSIQMIIEDITILSTTTVSEEAKNAMARAIEVLKKHL